MELEFGNGLAEKVFAGECESVHRAIAGLAQKYFIDVKLQYFLLAEAHLHGDRH